MKFLCENCMAKYQIADEKVGGRTVRMKCRKCGHMIEIEALAGEGDGDGEDGRHSPLVTDLAVQYQSVFVRQVLSSTSLESHLADYQRFRDTVHTTGDYRLASRLERCAAYPIPRPTFDDPNLDAIPETHPFKAHLKKRFSAWEVASAAWRAAWDRDSVLLSDLRAGLEAGGDASVVAFFASHFDAIPLPRWCPWEGELQFDEQEGILAIDCLLPHFGSLQVVKPRQSKAGMKVVAANQKEIREIANRLPYLLALRLMWEAVQLDTSGRIRFVSCNGHVIHDDPATGRSRKDVIMSVAAKPDEIRALVLDRVEPEICFRKLRGLAAPLLSDLVPIKPILHFDMTDKRFIPRKDVLHGIEDKNLATMDWQEFEHLIRELFEKEFAVHGAEVRVTQASRDRGVDAVVFDPDPLRGGKTIIQAKRYTTTVELSAVRDLYGTIQAVGANKGILVTTSNFGPDAYEFAKDKPITLLNGANLLHYLTKQGYSARIDLKEARELLRDPED